MQNEKVKVKKNVPAAVLAISRFAPCISTFSFCICGFILTFAFSLSPASPSPGAFQRWLP
jgi:hypothetical protein